MTKSKTFEEKKRSSFVLLVIPLLTLAILSSPSLARDNVVLLSEGDWDQGRREGLEITSQGELVLKQDETGYRESGSFISSPLDPGIAFTNLVPFWNASTPPGTKVKIKAKIKRAGTWSEWLALATWGNDESYTYSKDSRHVNVAIDTLKVRQGRGSEFKLRIDLHTENRENTPEVRLLGSTFWSSPSETRKDENSETSEYLRSLKVPKESQFEEESSIAELICSPTALSMVLQYFGRDVSPSEAAANVYDRGAKIYGNWSFNVAYAASRGLKSYVRYFTSTTGLKEEIAEGHPVVVSVAYQKGELQGAPIDSTAGHLLVVRGFAKRDGREYVIVNDPAAKSKAEVRRTYQLDQFVSAWQGIGYVFRPPS